MLELTLCRCFSEQLDHWRKHMEAGEPSVSTNISEDETEEDVSAGEIQEDAIWL